MVADVLLDWFAFGNDAATWKVDGGAGCVRSSDFSKGGATGGANSSVAGDR